MSRHAEPDQWKAATARQFDGLAETWRSRGVAQDDRLASLLPLLGGGPGSLVLDVGCGSGNWSLALARAGYRVRGVDLSPEMIARAWDAARELGLSEDAASFRVGDAERLDFPDSSFDALICFNVLDFTPRPAAALVEFRRVLRPGGRLVLIVLGAYSPVKWEWWRRFLPDQDGKHTGNDILPWETEHLLEELGWRIVDQHPLSGTTVHGVASSYSQEQLDGLPDKVLQQAVAAAWRFVAERPVERGP